MPTPPTPAWPDCPTRLSEQQRQAYLETGFLAFENALSPEEVKDARQALSDIVERYAFNEELATYCPPQNSGTTTSGAAFHGKQSRVMFQVEKGYTPEPDKKSDLELRVRKFMWFEDEAPIFRRICSTHERIQGVLRNLLGPESQLFQSMALLKPPYIGVEKPWHQDNAYFSVEDLDGVAGTWMALDDATLENGCMHFIPGGHRAGPLRHHHTYDCEIASERFDPAPAVPVPLKAGGIVFFHGNIPHRTPPNRSPHRRRALQYHYRRLNNRTVDRQTYDTIFTEADGSPASCAAALPQNL